MQSNLNREKHESGFNNDDELLAQTTLSNWVSDFGLVKNESVCHKAAMIAVFFTQGGKVHRSVCHVLASMYFSGCKCCQISRSCCFHQLHTYIWRRSPMAYVLTVSQLFFGLQTHSADIHIFENINSWQAIRIHLYIYCFALVYGPTYWQDMAKWQVELHFCGPLLAYLHIKMKSWNA